jgi:RND superfamily putative drug exporter
MDALVRVGGFPAAGVDFADYLGARLVWIIGGVLVVSFLLLMCVFRSLLVPLKAVVMNLLSIGAAYGIIVAIFQWGWAPVCSGWTRPDPSSRGYRCSSLQSCSGCRWTTRSSSSPA